MPRGTAEPEAFRGVPVDAAVRGVVAAPETQAAAFDPMPRMDMLGGASYPPVEGTSGR